MGGDETSLAPGKAGPGVETGTGLGGQNTGTQSAAGSPEHSGRPRLTLAWSGTVLFGIAVVLAALGVFIGPPLSIGFFAGTVALFVPAFLYVWEDVVFVRRVQLRHSKEEIDERERTNLADVPAPARELIRYLRIRYDESEGLYFRSLRASPWLFAAGLVASTLSAGSLLTGVVFAATFDAKPITLFETGSASILFGIMATGFFSWRRDLHKHALTFFCDMVHTRSSQTAIRMLASMEGWMERPDTAAFLRLIQRVARREAVRMDSMADQPKSLAPVAPEALADVAKEITRGVAKIAATLKK